MKKITVLTENMKKGLKFVILEIHYVRGGLGRKLYIYLRIEQESSLRLNINTSFLLSRALSVVICRLHTTVNT